MPLFNPRVKTDLSGFTLIGKVIQSIKAHHEEEARKKEIEKLLPAKYRGLTVGLSSKELGLLMTKVLLSKQQTREKAAASAEREQQITKRQLAVEQERSGSRERAAAARAGQKPPKADDTELLIEQLKATGEADDAGIANEIDAYRKTGKGDPHDILGRATKTIQPKVKGMGLGNPFYSTSLMKRIATALAQPPAPQETPPPAPPGGEAGGAGVPRGTSAAPADPEHAAAEAAKAAGYSRDDVVKHLQATGATPEQLKAVDEVYGIAPTGATPARSQGEAYGRTRGGSREGVIMAARAGAGSRESFFPTIARGLSDATDLASFAAPEAGIARGIPQVMDPLLKHLLPGWQGPGDSIMPHDVSVTPLPQGNDLAGMPTNDLTRGGFGADIEGKQSLLQLGQLLKALTGVP